jgi:hypothetical protein
MAKAKIHLVCELRDGEGNKIAENFSSTIQSAKNWANGYDEATVLRIFDVEDESETFLIKSSDRWSEAIPKMAEYLSSRGEQA